MNHTNKSGGGEIWLWAYPAGLTLLRLLPGGAAACAAACAGLMCGSASRLRRACAAPASRLRLRNTCDAACISIAIARRQGQGPTPAMGDRALLPELPALTCAAACAGARPAPACAAPAPACAAPAPWPRMCTALACAGATSPRLLLRATQFLFFDVLCERKQPSALPLTAGTSSWKHSMRFLKTGFL